MELEAPEVHSHPSEPDLHLVGDADTTGCADFFIRGSEEPGNQLDLPRRARHGLADEATHTVSSSVDLGEQAADSGDVRPRLGAEDPAVGIRKRNHVRPRRAPLTPATVELVRRQIDQRRQVAVVGVVEHEHVATAGVGAREAQGQVVRLAAGVREEHHRQRIRQRVSQPPGVADERTVQVAGVGVQLAGLPRESSHDPRVCVPHVGHVVHQVEIAPPVLVEEPCALAAHDAQRVGVGEGQRARQRRSDAAASPPTVGGDGAAASPRGSRSSRFGSGDRDCHTVRSLGAATPGTSSPRPTRSSRSCRWRCGGHPPFTSSPPTSANRSPFATDLPDHQAVQRLPGEMPVERPEGHVRHPCGARARSPGRSPAAPGCRRTPTIVPASGAWTGSPAGTKRSTPRWTLRASPVAGSWNSGCLIDRAVLAVTTDGDIGSLPPASRPAHRRTTWPRPRRRHSSRESRAAARRAAPQHRRRVGSP